MFKSFYYSYILFSKYSSLYLTTRNWLFLLLQILCFSFQRQCYDGMCFSPKELLQESCLMTWYVFLYTLSPLICRLSFLNMVHTPLNFLVSEPSFHYYKHHWSQCAFKLQAWGLQNRNYSNSTAWCHSGGRESCSGQSHYAVQIE